MSDEAEVKVEDAGDARRQLADSYNIIQRLSRDEWFSAVRQGMQHAVILQADGAEVEVTAVHFGAHTIRISRIPLDAGSDITLACALLDTLANSIGADKVYCWQSPRPDSLQLMLVANNRRFFEVLYDAARWLRTPEETVNSVWGTMMTSTEPDDVEYGQYITHGLLGMGKYAWRHGQVQLFFN